MIRTLHVRNLAVIQELELEFGPGLNVLTGETGAGKSVLLEAVRLISGGRVGSSSVRAGADEASAEAILEGGPLAVARARGLAGPADTELLVARTLPADGSRRARVRVQGSLATVSLLGELVGTAVEVASQGDYQHLIRPEVQAELLDRFGGTGPSREALEARYCEWRDLGREIEDRVARSAERVRREDQLSQEIRQIEDLDPAPGEIDELEAEHRRLAHADRLAHAARQAHDAIDGDAGIRDRLGQARAVLAQNVGLDPDLGPLLEGLERAALEVEEAAVSLARYGTDLEADPGRLAAVERRLEDLGRLRSRYGDSVHEILQHRDAARRELDQLAGGQERIAELEARRASIADTLESDGLRLSELRRKAAAGLEQAVLRELGALDLGGALFEVRLEPLAVPQDLPAGPEPFCGPQGRERARFHLAANAGEGSRKLKQAASGGELSRLYLALRNALRDAGRGGILIFDEIDAGIGGKAATRVGERLRALATRHQVLCVTHLPQIAALAETHHRVAKRRRAGRTVTRIERLGAEDRVQEIARMAGGGRVTAAARAHARELLESQ
ncbi:MAG: DNA repair protein RecN [Myxococcota bacterium]|nr:DNA repair protein RecN [Myxococcota bacterium]